MSYDAFEPVGFGKDIFKQRYAIHPEETWEDACRRIASFIASAERNGKRLEWEERFYKELVSNRFIPGGRIMYGAGRAKAALINCFHKNSPVVTERGVLPITEVEIGDRVLTHDGTFQKVVNKFDQGVRESLLNITIDRMPKNSLQVTPEHKIMTKRGWVEAQNLTKDDFVSIAGYKDSFEVPTEINVKDYITLDYDLEDVEGMLHKLNVASGTTKFSNESGRSKYSQQIVPIKNSIPVNEDLFKLLGYYISEGCAAKTSPVVLFTFSKKETGYVEEVVSLCGSLFGVEAVVRDYKSWVQVVISSNLLNNFLTNFIGSSFDSKILPWWILNCPEEWRLTLLAYACRGDSHTDKKTGSTNLVMCNPHVMQQLFFIAQELGLAYSFKTLYKKEERHSTPYGLYISKVGYRDNIFSQFLDKLGHDVVYHDDPYWRKVLSVEEVPYNDVVWDISVDKNHSLQINGIVASNCFVIGSDDIDSREGWAKNLGDMLIISGLGGGVGINFSDIRPRGTKIHGTGGEATGAVSFMELINNIGEVIKGGGGRRSALMECLNIDHPDIIEFIDKKFVHIDLDLNNSEEVISFVRKNLQLFDSAVLGLIKEVCSPEAPPQAKQMLSSMVKVFLEKNLRNANVSVVFNDDPEKFFEKVRNKEMHQLKWKGQVISEVRADKLWDKIITNALAGGEPGVLNMYLANKASNIPNVGPLVSTNPCITDDNWIHTLEGPRQVKDLIGKKFTALIDGKPFDSTDEGFFYKGEKEVVLVTLDNGIELKCTPDHKILSVSEDGTEKMIPVSEIGIGGTVKLQNQRGSEWSGKGSFEEGWLLGSLIGDGTFGSSNSIEESVDYAKLTYWGEEKEAMYQQAVGYVTSNYGDYNGRFAKSSTENSYNKNLSLQSAPLMRFALGFGITRNNKRITETFEKEASSEAYKGLLRGLFDADGSVQGDSISGHTIRLSSSDLRNLKGAHRLLGRLGVMSKIYPNRRKERMKLMPDGKGGMKEYPCKAQHEIIISKGNIVLFRDIVGFSEPAKVTKLDSIISSRKKSFKIEKFVSKIKEIVSIGIEKVYDCTIPGPHMFDANQCGVSNCGEIAMTPHEVCDLAHIVLPRFIRDNGQVDWASLADTITAGIRFLDNVLDVTTYPTEEIRVKATNTRRLGLGITGLHDALLLMGLKYSSQEGRDAAAKIMKFVKNKSYEESVFLAAERGVYGFYDHEAIKQSATYKSLKPSVRHQIDERGLRNCALNTIAPCGCQKPDTMVLTDQGLLELGELGDSSGETWQKLDNIQAVQETSRQDATQFFVNGVAKTKIITLSSGIELEGTYNHRYRVLDSDGSYVWKRVDELKNGDKIVVRMDGYSKLENQKLENILEDLHGNTKVIKFPDEVTKEFAEFIGIYFADGSNHDKGIRIACDASKNTHMRVIELSRELFDIEPIIEEVRNCIYVCLNSQMLLKLLAINGLLKGKSYEVSIPKNIRTSSRGSLWAFIHGYYLGDGHIEGSSFRTWDTVSKKMCQQLLVALRSLGVYAKSRILPKDDEHLGTRDVYRIREYSMFSLGKEDAIRYVSRDLQEDYRNIKNIGEFLAIDEVDSIVDSVSMTLDIEVPETHTYLSNSVVSHNTNSIVSGVSSSAEPIMGPAYERMWWVGDEKNSEVVIHPLFEQFVIEGKDVSHFEYAEEIDPKDHLRMQAALQEHIDNAISKTIAIPSTYTKKQFSEDLMEFLPLLKGITVYPIGSRGESPIKPLSIEKAVKVVKDKMGRVGTSQEQENQDCPNGVCSLG